MISARMGDGSSFVVLNSTFTHCSAMYGGAVYLVISGDPSLIEMSDVIFEENSASSSNGGNTLYIVWKSTSSMDSTQFDSFETSSEDEVKVETWKGTIVTFGEFVSGGSGCGSEGGEGKNGYKVCTEIEITEKVGTVKVAVLDREEEMSGQTCVVGMEEGEVEGEVSGEGVRVNMGRELTEVLSECEDIQIVMNVTYGCASNG